MRTCGNKTLDHFLKTLDDFLQEFSPKLDWYNGEFKENKLNIPFHISVLWQEFKNNCDKYNEFIQYLNKYEYYFNIDISNLYDVRIYVRFYKNATDDSDEEDIPVTYEFSFGSDQRYYGDCDCTPNDKDYREDKECCGHGCDWDAPNVDIYKRELINDASWQGDQHDYWDFEDEFYLDDKEANEKRMKEEREYKIKNLKETIENAQKELKELENL